MPYDTIEKRLAAIEQNQALMSVRLTQLEQNLENVWFHEPSTLMAHILMYFSRTA
jgi:hypothetical protein